MKTSKLLLISICFMREVCTFAGGYITNTNHSLGFLRNPSREGSIAIDGVYYNPAGVAFLNEGFFGEFTWQYVQQTRNSQSAYGQSFALNKNKPATNSTNYQKKYNGNVDVPIQPALYFVYNKNNWSYQFGFNVVGGGGTCEYPNGIGSLEDLVAQMGMKTLGNEMEHYNANVYLKGTSFTLGFTTAVARKVSKSLSVSVGLRYQLVFNNYLGHLRNIEFYKKGITTPIPNILDYELDCSQKAFGISPIIGVDFRPNKHWNFSAKYEFMTKLSPKTKAKNNEPFNTLSNSIPAFYAFTDGAKSKADMPGLLAIGVQYSPISPLRLNAGYHHFMDTATRQWRKDIVKDTNEFSVGIEYDITSKIEIAAGYQKTIYNQENSNLSDMSFCLNSWSFGLGGSFRVNKNTKLNASYFQTNYHPQTIATNTSRTVYTRTNYVVGMGVEVNF